MFWINWHGSLRSSNGHWLPCILSLIPSFQVTHTFRFALFFHLWIPGCFKLLLVLQIISGSGNIKNEVFLPRVKLLLLTNRMVEYKEQFSYLFQKTWNANSSVWELDFAQGNRSSKDCKIRTKCIKIYNVPPGSTLGWGRGQRRTRKERKIHSHKSSTIAQPQNPD